MYESFAKLYVSTLSVKLWETKKTKTKKTTTDFRFKQFARKMVTINVPGKESVLSQKHKTGAKRQMQRDELVVSRTLGA